jgi:uncharacterized lipoprotein NlpE involved in copper resistance
MKKIIITFLLLITLTSCNEKQEVDNIVESEVIENEVIKNKYFE